MRYTSGPDQNDLERATSWLVEYCPGSLQRTCASLAELIARARAEEQARLEYASNKLFELHAALADFKARMERAGALGESGMYLYKSREWQRLCRMILMEPPPTDQQQRDPKFRYVTNLTLQRCIKDPSTDEKTRNEMQTELDVRNLVI